MELKNLPEIDFVQMSLEDIIAQNISEYERIFKEKNGVEKKLYPGDPMRIYIYTKSLREYQLLYLINDIGKKNLLRYASGDLLRHLGAFFNTDIFGERAAKTQMKIILSKTFEIAYVISKGARFTPGNELFFITEEDYLIAPGNTEITVPVICSKAGTIGNDFVPGQINILADSLPFIESVSNIETSYDGAEIEDEDEYKERIRLAPGEYSSAGPDDAYKSMTKKFSQDVQDVHVYSLVPGVVEIVVAMKSGLPSEEIKEAIKAFVSDKKRRPLTDKVNVSGPTLKAYNIELTYYISADKSLIENQIKTKVNEAVEAYKVLQSSKIGKHINPSLLQSMIIEAGAERIVHQEPIYTQLAENELASIGSTTISYGGIENVGSL